MKTKTDFLIVGSGLYGSVLAERTANKLNKKVIIFLHDDCSAWLRVNWLLLFYLESAFSIYLKTFCLLKKSFQIKLVQLSYFQSSLTYWSRGVTWILRSEVNPLSLVCNWITLSAEWVTGHVDRAVGCTI